MDDKTNTEKEYSEDPTPEIVKEVLPNDILLGRGALAITNEGNIRFRNIIRERKTEYMSTSRRQKKAEIVGQVREEVAKRKGRFIRRVRDEDDEYETLGIAKGAEAWVVADEDIVMQKIKQSLRDKETESAASRAAQEPTGGKEPLDKSDASPPREKKRVRIQEPESSSLRGSSLEQRQGGSSSILARSRSVPRASLRSQIQSLVQQQPAAPAADRLFPVEDTSFPWVRPGQQNQPLPSLDQRREALDHLRAVRQEGERQTLIRQLELEREATLRRLHRQDLMLATLRSGSSPPFISSMILSGRMAGGGGELTDSPSLRGLFQEQHQSRSGDAAAAVQRELQQSRETIQRELEQSRDARKERTKTSVSEEEKKE